MNIDDIYTPIEEAKKQIQERWKDENLKKKVDEYLGNDIPSFLLDSPKAYLARHISSPNFEFFLFKELAGKIGLEFVLSEFTDDIFTTENTSKYHLGKMFFEKGVGKRGGKDIITELIIDFNNSNGKKLREIKTLKGECITDFHHKLLRQHEENEKFKIHDFSDWLKKFDSDPEKFYRHFLAFFIRNGILFENFLLNKEEKKFTIEKVLPSFIFLTEKFGVKPIIVRLLPKGEEESPHWLHYHHKLKDSI